MIEISSTLICPSCQTKLSLTSNHKSIVCENGHLFDRAKQGYFNLLLSQHKNSKQPGDSQEMILARRNFLDLGHYQSIVDTMAKAVQDHLPKALQISYADIACGEGYYAKQLVHMLTEKTFALTGIDISTPAIKSACKRDKHATWLVANAFHLPLADRSQDLVSVMFARLNYAEIARILKPEAVFVEVQTGNKHLIELREQLYETVNEKNDASAGHNVGAGLRQIKSIPVQKSFCLHKAEDLSNLLLMTPHYWRARPERKAHILEKLPINLSLDAKINVYQKSN